MESLIPISLISALIVFLAKIWFERDSIRCAIIADMQLTLRRANESLEALERDDHYWLMVGTVLTRAPSEIEIKSSLFIAVLPKLHLLGAKSVVRVLAFYTHFQFCEGLKRSLFQHIETHAKSKAALTNVDADLLRIQNLRICAGLKSLICHVQPAMLYQFRSLPLAYEIPTTTEITKMVNTALIQKSRVVLLR